MRYLLLPLIISALILVPTFPVSAANASPLVSVSTAGGEITFSPFGSIGSIAVGDLGQDGSEEIIVGAGKGELPHVAVYRQDGSAIGTFPAYAEGFTGGVNVAVCDVDGDDVNEIVTGARFGGGPHIRIFSNMGVLKYAGFFAYAEDFRGGVNVACGDIDNDGTDDIVTGAGLSGGPHIKVFTNNGTLKYEVFNGSTHDNTGAFVRTEGATIVTARVGVGDTTISSYTLSNDVLTATGTRTDDRAAYFTSATLSNSDTVRADITSELASDTSEKYIKVDISEQRIYLYEYGIQVNTFLVSTGKAGYDTPLGKTTVTAKLPIHNYVWYYGENNVNNYNIPNVKWNLRFRTHFYIHSAFWHNNFGQRMSHGCVNMSIPESEIVYNWANVGTPVEIVE